MMVAASARPPGPPARFARSSAMWLSEAPAALSGAARFVVCDTSDPSPEPPDWPSAASSAPAGAP
ncbi:hypothetical protein ACFQ9X_02795 [Catenulispora yoronensis]